MKKGKIDLSFVLMAAGILLVLLSVVLVLITQISAARNAETAKNTANKLYSLMPDVTDGFFETGSDTVMPMYELDGKNYVGVVEIPLYEATLPVYAMWDKGELSKQPCRYAGSIYDGSLVIGASDNKGQFDFMKAICETDTVLVTDMTGARYMYEVTAIETTKDVSSENLTGGDGDLVLFARNSTSFDYTVVRCTLKTNKKGL